MSEVVNLDSGATGRRSLWRRFLKHPLGVAALAVVLLFVLVAVFAPLLAPFDPNHVQLPLTKAGPSASHPLGGDSSGRDVLSRLLVGARTTLYGAAIAVVTGLVLGLPPGIAGGYFGNAVDRVLCWISDMLQALPGMVILLIVAAGSGANFVVLMITVGVLMMPGYFRLTRTTTLDVRGEAYIEAARVSGLGHGRIMFRHVIGSVYAPIIIQTALTMGMAMGMQAGLQFLGVGNSNVPNWGAMMNDGFQNISSDGLLLLWPSLALGLGIAAFALIGSTMADVVNVRAPRRQRNKPGRSPGSSADRSGAQPSGIRPQEAGQGVAVDNLRVSYPGAAAEKEVVHGISFVAEEGTVLGIVGESGSGKSQTVFSILDLLPDGGAASADAMWINGIDATTLSKKKRQAMLGSRIGYVPQEPMTNLDPNFTIGGQLTEPLRTIAKMSRSDAAEAASAMLERVGIENPSRVMASYPHQLSGGMAQRVLIAGAILPQPSVLIADEPTTALDVTVQAEVLELLRELRAEYAMTLVLVTHNFGVVADICDRVVVMRDGQIVESGAVGELFSRPEDDYTRSLIDASLDHAENRIELDAMADDGHRKVTV